MGIDRQLLYQHYAAVILVTADGQWPVGSGCDYFKSVASNCKKAIRNKINLWLCLLSGRYDVL